MLIVNFSMLVSYWSVHRDHNWFHQANSKHWLNKYDLAVKMIILYFVSTCKQYAVSRWFIGDSWVRWVGFTFNHSSFALSPFCCKSLSVWTASGLQSILTWKIQPGSLSINWVCFLFCVTFLFLFLFLFKNLSMSDAYMHTVTSAV